jgi:uncharacterized protein
MKNDRVFIDTSGFYAALVSGDSRHDHAARLLQEEFVKAGRQALTTDYIVDETATLLRMRGAEKAVAPFFRLIETSRALTLHFVHEKDFREAMKLFEARSSQGYSFTDCTSFTVMSELQLRAALTSDRHFQMEGFQALLTAEY